MSQTRRTQRSVATKKEHRFQLSSVAAKKEHRFQLKNDEQAMQRHKEMAFNSRFGTSFLLTGSAMLNLTSTAGKLLFILMIQACLADISEINRNKSRSVIIEDQNELPESRNGQFPMDAPVKTFIDEGLRPENCIHLQDSLLQLQATWLEGKELLQRVKHDPELSFVCIWNKKLTKLGVSAMYDPEKNYVYFAAKEDPDENMDIQQELSHELTHYADASRHRTPYCNLGQLSTEEISDIKKLGVPKGTPLASLLPSPLWKPIPANMGRFRNDVIIPDVSMQLLGALINDNQETRGNCKDRYLFEGLPVLARPIIIPLTAEEVETYANSLPNVIYTLGMGFKHLKVIIDGGQRKITGMVNDPVSQFIINVKIARNDYDQFSKEGNVIRAMGEFSTNIRAGLPRAALQKYFPHLMQAIEDDEACCVKGDKSRCWP